MPRSFPLVPKKRGHRRTGSRWAGSVGEALFFAFLFFAGCMGAAIVIAGWIVPEWRVSHEFVEQSCKVLDHRVLAGTGVDGSGFRPEVKIEYQVGGVTHVEWVYDIGGERQFPTSAAASERLKSFPIGQSSRCWYDPRHPGVAVVVRGQPIWLWVSLLIPATLIAIGGGGFYYSLRHLRASTERNAAGHGPFGRTRPTRGAASLPSVPDTTFWNDSPGTNLPIRLPIGTDTAWFLFWLGLACVLWNAVVAGFVVVAIDGIRSGHPDWWLTLCIIPFVAAGVGLIVYFVRKLLLAAGVGLTLVEISAHPLTPGQQYKVFVSHAGRARLKRLSIALVCEEEAVYRQGTNTHSECRQVFKLPLLHEEAPEVAAGCPIEVQCELKVPCQAMHSFKSDHNEVRWKILVCGSLQRGHEYQRSFPVLVYPRSGGMPA